MTDLRVRIAPSPTGAVHLGLCRTALFNWAYAKKRGGKFILRIEDTDRTRSTEESERAIVEGLRWLGVQWDEGPDVGGPHAPYRQSERAEGHGKQAVSLLGSGHAYRCFCTPERLAEVREAQEAAKETPRYDGHCRGMDGAESQRRADAGEPFAIRFLIPEGSTTIHDLVRGEVTFDHKEIDDWIMARRDGTPTYNFVVVSDDVAMEISHVFRGEEHLVNTPKQLLLYQAMGYEPPRFAHLPLMLGKDRKKLSKRSGDTSLGDYIANGYPKAAIVNFLCLQGWALDGETEVFDVDTFVEHFDIENVQKAGAVFDIDKFRWLSADTIRRMDVAELSQEVAPFVIQAGQMTADEIADRRDWFQRLVAGEQERIDLFSEFPPRVRPFFEADDAVTFEDQAEAGARKHEGRVETLGRFADWLRGRDASESAEAMAAAVKDWVKEEGLKFPALFQPLRCALTGMAGGRDLFDCIELLGRESALARIEAGQKRLA
ncbi:Glutamate--tRNA ligase 1 [Planctomycetes bacterium Poly30]|uniref:Glutamate--tRNA ligase n=1 Tax=Saltatorellus ferox TaxID=2528018 RepID=A0A518EUG8_9BACT|nr:Glutamate--tRNA ligase 1 [Planctomycetes bacterium Poly30]